MAKVGAKWRICLVSRYPDSHLRLVDLYVPVNWWRSVQPATGRDVAGAHAAKVQDARVGRTAGVGRQQHGDDNDAGTAGRADPAAAGATGGDEAQAELCFK